MPVRLDPNPYTAPSEEHTAYQRCLSLEAAGEIWGPMVDFTQQESSSEPPMAKFSPLVAARTLGYGLIHAPLDAGRASLAREINSCIGDTGLAGLAQIYVLGLFRVLRNPKGPMPESLTPYSPRLSFDARQETIQTLLSRPTMSSREAKKAALMRDNYRCIVSGALDNKIDIEDPTRHVPPEPVKNTELAHIFSESMMEQTSGFTETVKAKRHWAASAATIVERFGGISLTQELNQNDIHKPENTFTMAADLHISFDRLEFSLHPIEPDNGSTYEIRTYPQGRNDRLGLLNEVTLTDASGGPTPLPSRRYLALHDACANIAHLSGAGEAVDKILQDLEETKVMATDGGSKDLVSFALSFRLNQLSAQ